MGKAPTVVTNPRIAKLIQLEAEGRIKPEHQQELDGYRGQGLAPPRPKGVESASQRQRTDLSTDEALTAIKRARELINKGGWLPVTGFGADIASGIGGTAARDLKSALSTVASGVTLGRLADLKAASANGASGMGSLTEKEGELLRDSVAGLDQFQSKEQLLQSLDAVEHHYRNVAALQDGQDISNPDVQRQYGIVAGATAGGDASPPASGGAPVNSPTGSPESGPSAPIFRAMNEAEGPYITPSGPETIDTQYKGVDNPDLRTKNQQVLAAVAANRPDAEVLKLAESLGVDPVSTGLGNILAYRKKTGLLNYADTTDYQTKVPLSTGERIANTIAANPIAEFVGEAGNAVGGGIPQAVARGIGGENMRRNLDAARNTNPTAALTGELTGGVLGAAGSEALASRGLLRLGANADRVASWAPRIGDVAFGGVSGATGNPDAPATGFVLGAGAGGGGGLLGRGIARGVAGVGHPRLTAAEGTLLNTASRGVGVDAIDARLATAADLGVPMGLADASSELTSLGGAAIRRSPAASEVAQNALIPRSRGQIDRLGTAVERDLGPVGNIPQLTADLSQQARTAAAPLYEAAYAAPGAGAVYPKISDLLSRPSMQSALARARRIALEEGRDPTSLGFDLSPEGNVTLTRVPSWQTLDYAKRGLDDVLEGYRDPTSGRLNLDTEGRAINDTRKSFLGIVDEANPAYRDARAAYAGPAGSRDALNAGKDAYRANPDQLGVDIAGATPERLGQMQLGYRGALMDAANGYRTSTNPFEATLGTPAAEQRLGVLYGNTPETQRLLATRDLERQMASSTNSMLGNSATAQRQIADEAFTSGTPGALLDAGIDGLAGGPASGLLSLVRNGLRDGTRLGLGRRAVRRADDLAPMLFGTDPAAARVTLGDLMRRAQVRRDAGNNLSLYGGPIGSGGGALLGGYLASGGN